MFSFDTENGISVRVTGSLKKVGNEEIQVMDGFYSYTSPDGSPVEVSWHADETGFHPTIKKLF